VRTATLDHRPPPPRRSDAALRSSLRGGPLVVGLLAGAYAVASLTILPSPGPTPTTYVTSVASAAMLAAAGLGMIAVGVASWIGRPTSATGPLATVAGVAWLAPLWVGWVQAPALARSLAAVAALLVLPAVAHLGLAAPSDRAPDPTSRVLAAIGWAVTGGVSVGLALFRNPLQDLRCWSNCSANNVFLLSPNLPVARALGGFWLWFSVAFGAAVIGLLVRRLTTATAAWRVAAAPLVGPVVVVLAGQAAYAALLIVHREVLRDDPVEPAHHVFRSVFTVRAAGMVLLAVGVGWALVRDARRRTAIVRLAEELAAAPTPGTLETVLARSLGDRDLRVRYWLPSLETWVDPSGRPVDGSAGRDRATVTIQRRGQPVARVDHDRALGSVELVGRIGSAARLAIDNERLRAELLAQLEEVRESRSRLVEAGDTARRSLERDLHDGAQQRLLAAASELRWAQDVARDHPERVAAIERLLERTRDTLAELRELAHGIFPVALDDAGLAAGLWELATGAAVPVEIDEVPATRFRPAVERTAYLVVAEAADRGLQHGSTELRGRLRQQGGELLVEVAGARADPYTHLADRVSAVGGILTVAPGRLQAVIPCASSSPTTPC
jgi:signal transduction histidine kinase